MSLIIIASINSCQINDVKRITSSKAKATGSKVANHRHQQCGCGGDRCADHGDSGSAEGAKWRREGNLLELIGAPKPLDSVGCFVVCV